MNKFSKPVCIVILGCLLVITILYAKAPAGSAESKPKVLIEAITVQVNSDVWQILRMNAFAPGAKVTIPVAKLLWLLTDSNSAKVLESAKIKVWPGQTGKLSAGEKVKFLVKKESRLEEKTTDTPIGTTL